MVELKAVLDDRLAHVVLPRSLIQTGENITSRDTDRSGGRRSNVEGDNRELHTLIKTLRVKVPQFDGLNVDDWIYKINKFFTIGKYPFSNTRKVLL